MAKTGAVILVTETRTYRYEVRETSPTRFVVWPDARVDTRGRGRTEEAGYVFATRGQALGFVAERFAECAAPAAAPAPAPAEHITVRKYASHVTVSVRGTHGPRRFRTYDLATAYRDRLVSGTPHA